MTDPLTPNAIHRLNAGDNDLRPILQVMDIRQIGNNNQSSAQERFRLVLSDGLVVQQAMLATQLNEMIKSKAIMKGTIVQLVEYICNTVQNRKIIIVLNMEIRQAVADIIGTPGSLASGGGSDPGGGSAANVQPPQQPQEQQQFRQDMNVQGRVGAQPQQPSHPSPGSNWEPRQNGGPPAQVYKGTTNVTSSFENGYVATSGAASFPAFQAQRGMGGMNSSAGTGMDATGYGQASPYGRPLPPYQPAPMYSVRGPISRNEAPARIVPIAALNPYQGRWTVKARVTSKGILRRYHNSKGEGKVFSFDLLDADGGEIRCTCFNTVADQFYDRIEAGRVYLVSKGSLKPSQKQFNHLNSEWEVTLENASTIELCTEGDANIPQQIFEFKLISDLENLESNAMVDLVGIATNISDSQQIMRKNGTETVKRSVTLKDHSGKSVELTMWGSFCAKEGEEIQQEIYAGKSPVIALKAGRVSDFSGKSIGTLNTSQVMINPDLPEAHKLKAWHNSEGKNTVAASISREGAPGGRNEARKLIAQIKDENLGRNEKPDWISIKATISFVKADTFCYTACPLKVNDKVCAKKVTNNGDGTWHCDRCDQRVPECEYRYLLQMQVQDHSGITWVNGFQEAGEEIFGVPAKDLFMWKQAENPKFTDTIQRALFSAYMFKVKVKEETFQDEARVKCTLVKSEKLNFASEGRLLLDCIKQVEKGGPIPTTQPTAGGYSGQIAGASYAGGGGGGGGGGSASPYIPSGYTSSYSGSAQGTHTYGSSYGNTSAYSSNNEGSGGLGFRNDGFQGGGGGGGSGACYHCGQGGHFARECPNKGSRQGGGYGGGGYTGGSGYGGRGF